MRKKIYYFTNIAPHYRESFWRLLAGEKLFDFHFFFGNSPDIKGIAFSELDDSVFNGKIHVVKNIRVGKLIVWQKGVIQRCLQDDFDSAILLSNVYIISNWLAAIILKIRKKKVIFWGHGFYGGENFLIKKVKVIFHKLANHHFLYGHRAKSLMVEHGFPLNKLTVVYNSLDYKESIKLRTLEIKEEYKICRLRLFRNPDLPLLIFIGRLTKVKKLSLLMKAFKILNEKSTKYNLLVIGDGKEKQDLSALVRSEITQKCIYFYGACYSEFVISQLIRQADLCVSPGNVGLTAIHCLSYGVPVCTHGNFNKQMPEVEAIITHKTGFFFEEDNYQEIAKQVEKWFEKKLEDSLIRQNCYEIVDAFYNPYAQLRLFKQILI